MIWLILAAVAALGAGAAGVLASRGPLVNAGAVLGVWLSGRLAAALVRRGRGAEVEGGAAGAAAPDGEAGAWQQSVTARAGELEAARDAARLEALARGIARDAVPGISLELWLTTDGGGWRRPGGAPMRELPPVSAVVDRLVSERGALPVRELAGAGGQVAELLAAAPAPWVAPIARGDRLFGLLFAGGASEAGEVLALLGPAVAEALGHVRMVGRIALASEMEAEVELAAAVQQAFIPDGTARIIGPIELAASYVPASQCGGDWWAVHEMGDGRVLLLVADVTGHGIGAARITAAARGAHDVAVRLAGGQPDLPGLLQALDSAVRHVGAGHYHMTCFAAVIDPDLVIHFTSAGHVPPYLCRAPAGPGDRIAIDALVARGNPLGINRPPVVQVLEQTLRPGDLLLFHSDGLVDCTSPREERLGDRRMQRLLRQLASQSLDIGQIRDRLDDAIREHTGGSPQDDDITFIAVRGQAPPGNSME